MAANTGHYGIGTIIPSSIFKKEEQRPESLEGHTSNLKIRLRKRTAEEVTELLQEISQFSEPKTIELNECVLGENASMILKQFQNLNYLALIRCQSHQVNLQFFNLLEHLDLSESGIKSLPDSLAQLKGLRTLKLMHCALVHVPPVLSQLINLKELNIGVN